MFDDCAGSVAVLTISTHELCTNAFFGGGTVVTIDTIFVFAILKMSTWILYVSVISMIE